MAYARRRQRRRRRRSRRSGYAPRTGRAGMRTNYTPRITRLRARGTLPDEMYVQMKYTDVVNMTAAVPLTAAQKFAINGVYDPDLSSTGHQPRSHDQWAAFYNHYEVTACAIRLRITNQGNAAAFIVVPQSYDASAVSNHYQAGEVNMAKTVLLAEGNGSGETISYVQHYVGCAKIGGHEIGELSYQGTMGSSNPSRTHKWTLLLGGQDIVSGTATAKVWTELIYYVRLFDRKVPGTS